MLAIPCTLLSMQRNDSADVHGAGDRVSRWEAGVIRWGIFLVFIITFGEYVFQKVWAVIGVLGSCPDLAHSHSKRVHKEDQMHQYESARDLPSWQVLAALGFDQEWNERKAGKELYGMCPMNRKGAIDLATAVKDIGLQASRYLPMATGSGLTRAKCC